MSQWWTYSLSDFLLFSPRTYRRLFELYNTQAWPMHTLALAAGIVVAWAMWRVGAGRLRAAMLLLAALWAWVAFAFFIRHYASINWAAPAMAAAFAIEAALLGAAAMRVKGVPGRSTSGVSLLLFGLLLQPLIGLLLGRPWRQLDVFGMAPDPTVTVTLGVLALWPPGRWSLLLWPIPLLWCAVGAATSWAMHDPDAWVMPAVAAWAVAAKLLARRRIYAVTPGADGTG